MPAFTVEVYSNRVWLVTRRKRGEGSCYQRKDGSWVAQFKGKYRYAKDEDAAKQKLYAMLSQRIAMMVRRVSWMHECVFA
jgi:hypothetical protein